MFRSSTPFLDVSGLEDLRAQYAALGKYAFADALQEATNAVAEVAQARMAGGFERDIEGGPARFTRILPGNRASSVLVRRHKGATKGVASSEIEVQDRQARYLAYMLGEKELRTPGDVGVATAANFIPNARGLVQLGLTVTAQGGLPRNGLKKLVALARRGKVGHGLKKSAFTRDFDADRNDRSAGKGSGETVFYGAPTRKGGQRGTEGFWLRPAASTVENGRRRVSGAKKGGLTLLAAAVPSSDYGNHDYLVPAWNEAVEGAGRSFDEIAREVLEARLDRYYAGRQARADNKNAKARQASADAHARLIAQGVSVHPGQSISAAARRASRG